MPVKLNSSGGGSVTLDVPSTASAFNLTLPATNGALGINLGTAQNSTSGTAIDFTGIPAGVRRITVIFNGVSTNGSSDIIVQIGSTIIATSGYLGSSGNRLAETAYSAGYRIASPVAATSISGNIFITNVTGNVWVESHVVGMLTPPSTASGPFFGGGAVTLSGTLDRARITTLGGTDTFDAGSINIAWEF